MLSLLMMFGMGSTNVYAAQPDETNTTLNVALYGYVPDTERFEKAVQESWEKAEPNVTLNFVNWDCYEEEPTENVDVFVFDAIYLNDYIEKRVFNYLLEKNSIEDSEDILDFALNGCTRNNDIYAVPQIICTNCYTIEKGIKNWRL